MIPRWTGNQNWPGLAWESEHKQVCMLKHTHIYMYTQVGANRPTTVTNSRPAWPGNQNTKHLDLGLSPIPYRAGNRNCSQGARGHPRIPGSRQPSWKPL